MTCSGSGLPGLPGSGSCSGSGYGACTDNGAGSPCCLSSGPASQNASTTGQSVGAGNPLNALSDNKYQPEVDLPPLPGILGLEIVRYFNSLVPPSKSAPVHFHMPRMRSARSMRPVPWPEFWLCHSFSPGTFGCGQECSSKFCSNRAGMKRVRLA